MYLCFFYLCMYVYLYMYIQIHIYIYISISLNMLAMYKRCLKKRYPHDLCYAGLRQLFREEGGRDVKFMPGVGDSLKATNMPHDPRKKGVLWKMKIPKFTNFHVVFFGGDAVSFREGRHFMSCGILHEFEM